MSFPQEERTNSSTIPGRAAGEWAGGAKVQPLSHERRGSRSQESICSLLKEGAECWCWDPHSHCVWCDRSVRGFFFVCFRKKVAFAFTKKV